MMVRRVIGGLRAWSDRRARSAQVAREQPAWLVEETMGGRLQARRHDRGRWRMGDAPHRSGHASRQAGHLAKACSRQTLMGISAQVLAWSGQQGWRRSAQRAKAPWQ